MSRRRPSETEEHEMTLRAVPEREKRMREEPVGWASRGCFTSRGFWLIFRDRESAGVIRRFLGEVGMCKELKLREGYDASLVTSKTIEPRSVSEWCSLINMSCL